MRIIDEVKKHYIRDLVASGKRVDGRAFDEYRKIKVEKGIIRNANGSAYVELGATKVMVGVKMDVGEPYSDTPDKGAFTVNVEFAPLADPDFMPGPPGPEAIEVARVVDRAIRSSEAIDLESLVIVPGEKVYVVFIDVHVLDNQGNLIDATCLASMAALLDTKVPIYDESLGLLLPEPGENLKIKSMPVEVTFAQISGNYLVDPCLEEEIAMDARITFGICEEGVCATQKAGRGKIKIEDLDSLLDLAFKKAEELRKHLR